MKIWDDLLDEVKKNLPDEIECELKLMHSKSALTRFANSQIHQNVDEESAEIYLTIHKDSKTTTISNNLTAIKDVREFVNKALVSLEDSPIDKGWSGLPDKSNSYEGFKDIEESTPDDRAKVVKEFIEEGKSMNAAGYCSTYVNNYFVRNSNGLKSCNNKVPLG